MCFAAFIIMCAPVGILTWGYLQGKALYNECMTWEGATEQECSAYLDN